MNTKSKTFARKLTALFLAAIMAISCFMGTVTAFAKSTDDYHDSNLAYNFMTWAEATDDQTCEALLDWADLYMGDLLSGLLGTDHIYFSQNVVVATITIDAYLDSVDGLIDLIRQANDLLNSYGGIVGGDVQNLNLSPLPSLAGGYTTQGDAVISKCGKSYRANNNAKDIIMALAKTLYINSNDNSGNKNVLGQFVKGQLNLGSILEGALGGNVYSLLQNALGMWDGYQSNLVYNIVANLIFTNTKWYSESEIASYKAYLQGKGGTTWNFDNQLLDKLSTELLQQINVDVTYDVTANIKSEEVDANGDKQIITVTDDSRAHYQEIKAYMKAHNVTLQQASEALGYDPNLHYTDDGNVYLFRYGYQSDGQTPVSVFTINKESTLLTAAFDAIEIAWKTVLKDTLNLLHANYNNWENEQKGFKSNFDNTFYYWMLDEGKWNKDDWKSNYSDANVKAWAAAVAADNGFTDSTAVEDFLAQVKKDLQLSRTITTEEGKEASWRDIDATRLFMKLRYSPLADIYFDMQTGPINLYLLETGYSHLKEFIEGTSTTPSAFDKYDNIVAAFNDLLVAAVHDFFPQSKNIGLTNEDGTVESLTLPTMKETGNTQDKTLIASTLVSNAMAVFEYAANATDENILNPFYKANNIASISGNLSEANFEEAMMPLLIACLTQIDMLDPVHPEAWDKAKDAEGVAYIALREYLSYVLPDKNYDQLVTTENGYYAAKVDLDEDGVKDLYADVILFMARDAVGYLLNSIVPCRTPDGAEWNVYKSNLLTDKTTLFEILNSVICYYGSMDEFREPDGTTTRGKGVAALLGCVDGSGNCQVKMSNSLWQNINVIANKLLPVCGTLQYGTTAKAGQSDSKSIIYDTIVMGLLDIGDNKGITTILEQLVTVCTSEPMQKSALLFIYDDVVAALVNGIFGARDSRQGYKKVIPVSSDYSGDAAKTPFDSLVQHSTLAQYENGCGVLGVLISNIYEFFGGNMPNYTTQELADGCWQGAMFAVNAVNHFIPSFVPQLSEHKFNAATLSLDNPAERVTAGTQRQSVNLKFANNCRGLNRFYKDVDGSIKRSPRYFVSMKDITYSLANGASISNISTQLPPQKIVAPEETSLIPVAGSNVEGTQLIKFTVTYDIFEGEYGAGGSLPSMSTPLYSDLQATCYLYLTTDKGWVEATFPETDETSGALSSADNIYDDTMFTWVDVAGNEAYISNDLVISTANTAQIDNYGISATGIDGLYAKDDNGDAYAVMDAKNGDLLNTGRVDYKLGEGYWNRGTTTTIAGATVSTGYTENDIQSIAQEAKDKGVEFATRPHVALTLSEAGNLVKTVEKDGDTYKSITVDKRLITSKAVSASTPTHGISFIDISAATGNQVKYMKYDGTSNIAPGNYTMKTVAYKGTDESEVVNVNVVIANDAEALSLQRVYDGYIKEMAPYQATDYEDYNTTYGSSDTNDRLQAAFQTSVQAISTPITLENAASLSSTYELTARTAETTALWGDVAYKPIPSSEALSGEIAKTASAYNGYWYLDEAHTMPIYKNEELTAADVTDGKDAAGTAVVYNDFDKKYHVSTAVKYEKEWVQTYNEGGTVYPYYTDSKTQAKNNLDQPLYDNTLYEYHMADGTQVGSGDNWVYKYAITYNAIKKNDTNDYRGFYQKVMDSLKYSVEEAKKHIDTKLVTNITDGVMEARKGKNNVNYEVATYEKMVKVAKEAESLVYVESETVDEAGVKVPVYSTTASSVEIREAKRQYDKYFAIAEHYNRGYKGDKLEAEIACASGMTYNNLDATVVEDATGAVTEATVTRTGTTAAKYGSYDSNNKLVNIDAATGEQAFSDASWKNYVAELAKSVKMAKAKDAEISAIFTQKSALAIAENNLAGPEEVTTFHITGKVVMATDAEGTQGTVGVKAAVYADGAKVGNTDANGNINLDVDLGVTNITVKAIAGESKFAERTVTVSGTADIANAIIPVNAFDLNSDGRVNSTDVVIYSDAPFDLDGNSAADENDGAIYKSILRSGVNFGSLALD